MPACCEDTKCTIIYSPLSHAWLPLSYHILHCIDLHLGMYSCHCDMHLQRTKWELTTYFLSWFPADTQRCQLRFSRKCFVFPSAAPVWPYQSSSHHNKALWIISLGQLILSCSVIHSTVAGQKPMNCVQFCSIESVWCSSCHVEVNG